MSLVMDVQVIDNFLPEEEFNQVKSVMLGDHIPWYWNSQSVSFKNRRWYRKVPQLIHNLSHYDHGGVCSEFCPLFYGMLTKLGAENCYILKANLNPRTTFRRYTGFHHDFDNIRSAVFYVNTNTGGTKFKNGKFIKSVENRIVTFDSNLQHTGVTCTKDRRVVVNINYT